MSIGSAILNSVEKAGNKLPDPVTIFLILIVVEVGLITPPVGMNLFIINSMAKDTPIGQTYRGAMPFVLTDMIRVVILAAFPPITLWLVWFIDGLGG